jgi:AI-2 transport protein TqsA
MTVKNQTFSPTVKFFIAIAALTITLWGLREGSEMIVQVVLAAVIAVSFTPLMYYLISKGLPSMVSYVLTLVAIVLVFGLLLAFLIVAVNRFVNEIPAYTAELDSTLADFEEFISENFNIEQSDAGGLIDSIDPGQILNIAADFFSGLIATIGSIAMIVLVLIFLLVDALSVPDKLAPYIQKGNVTVERVSRFGADVRHYVGITTVVGAATGVLDTIFFIIVGVDFPVLWGILAFLMSYIPTIGFWLALIPPTFLAFLEMGLTEAVIVFFGIVLINGFAENVVKPKYMGEGLDLSPFTVVFSVIFWAAILGPFGAILSVPLTMAFKMLILEYDPGNKWLAALMSAEPHEAPDLDEPQEETAELVE